jgi:hypothetical protein
MPLKFSRPDYTEKFKNIKGWESRDFEAFLLIDSDKYFGDMLIHYSKLLEADGRSSEATEILNRARYIKMRDMAEKLSKDPDWTKK